VGLDSATIGNATRSVVDGITSLINGLDKLIQRIPYDAHTVAGTWTIILTIIGGVAGLGVLVRALFPVRHKGLANTTKIAGDCDYVLASADIKEPNELTGGNDLTDHLNTREQ
jgi:hypothetical protein